MPRTRGRSSNLPEDAVVEVLAEVGGHGVLPLRTGPLPEALAAHLRHYVAVQRQMVKAALSGSRREVLAAFLLDPMTQSRLDLEETESMVDEMLAANARFLPRFAQAV